MDWMPWTEEERWLRQALCDAGRTLYERGLIGPTDGNFSARRDATTLLCTPSGAHKGRLGPQQLVVVGLDGAVVEGGRPSSELKMHLAIYAQRPDVKCVVHAHPPHAVALSVAGVPFSRPVVPEVLFGLGEVADVPYSSPTTDDVPHAIRGIVKRCDAFMMARHGSVILCADPDEGVIKTEILEHTAKIIVAAKAAGGARPLPEEEVRRILALAGRTARL